MHKITRQYEYEPQGKEEAFARDCERLRIMNGKFYEMDGSLSS